MTICRGVTATAFVRQGGLEVAAAVAAIAGDRGVPSLQRIAACLHMIEAGLLPVVGPVATRALGATRSAMDVVRRVAIDAAHRRALESRVPVTGRAGNLAVCVGQRKARFRMIKLGGLEGARFMALRAIRAELAAMGVVFTMTVHALLRRLTKLLSGFVARIAG